MPFLAFYLTVINGYPINHLPHVAFLSQVLLDELGFDDRFLDPLFEDYLKPLSRILFPEEGGSTLDSYKAFTVKYDMQNDQSLGYHFDNAEVTLNLCIGKNFIDGELYFGDMKEVSF